MVVRASYADTCQRALFRFCVRLDSRTERHRNACLSKNVANSGSPPDVFLDFQPPTHPHARPLCRQWRYIYRRRHYCWIACFLRTELRPHNSTQEPRPKPSTSRSPPTRGAPSTVSVPLADLRSMLIKLKLELTQTMASWIPCVVMPVPISVV
jgi:hypothetical protein